MYRTTEGKAPRAQSLPAPAMSHRNLPGLREHIIYYPRSPPSVVGPSTGTRRIA